MICTYYDALGSAIFFIILVCKYIKIVTESVTVQRNAYSDINERVEVYMKPILSLELLSFFEQNYIHFS